MKTPIDYRPEFFVFADEVFQTLWNDLGWVRRGNTPRLEYYCNDFNEPYTYGSGAGVRTYDAQPYHPMITKIRKQLEAFMNEKYEVCFLNGYRDGSDQLGWHADDSPEMDDARHIAIVSLGAKREIYFRPNSMIGGQSMTTMPQAEKLWLEHGSVCFMKPGMQDTHQHRIPKASYHGCGPRISLTFRGYVKV